MMVGIGEGQAGTSREEKRDGDHGERGSGEEGDAVNDVSPGGVPGVRAGPGGGGGVWDIEDAVRRYVCRFCGEVVSEDGWQEVEEEE
jgi:hypothetical protein